MKTFLHLLVGLVVAFAMALIIEHVGPAAAFAVGSALLTLAQHYGYVNLPEGLALIASLVSLSRKPRGGLNIGGIVKFVAIAEDDIEGMFPEAADIVGGELTGTPTLKTGATGVVFLPDVDSGMLKSSKKGPNGYQNHAHEGAGKFAGYEKEQRAALDKLLNRGALVFGIRGDGTRVLAGSSLKPMVFEEDTATGAKADDGSYSDLKFKADGLPYGLLPVAPSVTIPEPA